MSRVDALSTVEDWESYFDGFKSALAPLVYDSGEYPTRTTPDPDIHPEQTAWARQMRKGIYMPVDGRVYVAVGYQLCSTTMIVGDDGVVVIDPGETDTACAAAMTDLRRFSDLPVRGIIYTHRHADHNFALEGCGVTADDVRAGRVDVIAHATYRDWLINDAGLIGPILSARTGLISYAGGDGARGPVHAGIGPGASPGPVSTALPTIEVGDSLDLEIAGVRMTAFHAYGDAQDEIDVWFPDLLHVHGSETIQGETFPNLYTLRGTSYRDVEAWYRGVDKLLAHARHANSYSGSHMRPWIGNDFIVERITNYRDAIQFIHDQSVRHMNRGYTAAELVEAVRLPDHLRDDPWLQPYYGTPEHSVRAIYTGLLGWYNADPTELAAPLHRGRAERYVRALGGRERVLALSDRAMAEDDFGWAMELLTHVIRLDHDDMVARRAKAEAMRSWGLRQKNIFWRSFALGGAKELEGVEAPPLSVSFAHPAIVQVIPIANIVDGLRIRLDSERTADVDVAVAFEFTDTGDSYTSRIRRGVAVFDDVAPTDAAATVVTDTTNGRRLLSGDITLTDAVAAGWVAVRGEESAAVEFFGYFDSPAQQRPRLVVR